MFRHEHPAPQHGYKRRACANAHQLFASELSLPACAITEESVYRQRVFWRYGASAGVADPVLLLLLVENAIAMQLCPQSAAAWRGNPRLPSRACKFSSALTAKAYSAAGQAASALHAMALLQVHQVKALKQLHEGGADPGVFQEPRTATDLALRVTKIIARALGQTMSTLVVQEPHLWLTLAYMREAEKHRLLDSPISQAGLFGEAVEGFAQQFSAAQ